MKEEKEGEGAENVTRNSIMICVGLGLRMFQLNSVLCLANMTPYHSTISLHLEYECSYVYYT